MDDRGECVVRAAASDEDLRQVLALQATNLRDVLEAGDRASQGFVTLRHDLGLLREMGARWPHVVAVVPGDGPAGASALDQVVGYALTMPREFRARLPLLEPSGIL